MKNFTLLIHTLQKLGLYNVSQLNSDLRTFKYNRDDSGNKIPFNIFLSTSKQFKLSASHAWTLFIVFPLIIGFKFVNSPGYIYYKHFLDLIEILRMLSDDKYDDKKLYELANEIENYLNQFKNLYDKVPISAKMHNLVHYPRCIRMFGPPLLSSTMRWDSKHSFFKRVHHQNHNHINLQSSLAERHQEFQLFHLLSENYFLDFEFGSEHKISTDMKDLASLLIGHTELKFFNYISYQRANYTIDNIVVIKRKTQLNNPQFALINTIIYDEKHKLFYFLIEDLTTYVYEKNLTGYILKQKNDVMQRLITIDKLAHFLSLNSYLVFYEGHHVQIVVPKYAI
jgi:hypothetical protein